MKLSGWLTGGKKSRYELNLDTPHAMSSLPVASQPGVTTSEWKWHWEHDGGSDLEAALTVRLADAAQIALSVGQLTIAKFYYDYQTDASPDPKHGLLRMQQLYQTVAVRFVPFTIADQSRLVLQASFRNNAVSSKYKQGEASDKVIVDKLFFPGISNHRNLAAPLNSTTSKSCASTPVSNTTCPLKRRQQQSTNSALWRRVADV